MSRVEGMTTAQISRYVAGIRRAGAKAFKAGTCRVACPVSGWERVYWEEGWSSASFAAAARARRSQTR